MSFDFNCDWTCWGVGFFAGNGGAVFFLGPFSLEITWGAR